MCLVCGWYSMKFKRNEERALQHDLEQIGARLDNLVGEQSTIESVAGELTRRQGQLEQELQDQRQKEGRARQKEQRLRSVRPRSREQSKGWFARVLLG